MWTWVTALNIIVRKTNIQLIEDSQPHNYFGFCAPQFNSAYEARKPNQDINETKGGCKTGCWTGEKNPDEALRKWREWGGKVETEQIWQTMSSTCLLVMTVRGMPKIAITLPTKSINTITHSLLDRLPEYHTRNSQLWNQLRLWGPWCNKNSQKVSSETMIRDQIVVQLSGHEIDLQGGLLWIFGEAYEMLRPLKYKRMLTIREPKLLIIRKRSEEPILSLSVTRNWMEGE